MKSHFDLNDEIFGQQFSNCTLDPEIFNHEAHLRLAWIHITKYGIDTAIENVSTQLINYTTALGASGKYNKTLTIAAVKAVNHFIGRSQSNNFADFIKEFPRLKTNFKDLMAKHYKIDIFKLPLAKTTYLEPDLLPF